MKSCPHSDGLNLTSDLTKTAIQARIYTTTTNTAQTKYYLGSVWLAAADDVIFDVTVCDFTSDVTSDVILSNLYCRDDKNGHRGNARHKTHS